MASNPTSPRLRGCTVVKTELPLMMHSTSDPVYAFCFKGAFLTQHHQYVFYYGAKAEELLLARLCLYSHTWQVLPSFRLEIAQHTNLVVLPLPWTGDNNHHQVLLGFENNCKLLTLSQLANSGGNATTDPPETTSVCFHLLQPPENGIQHINLSTLALDRLAVTSRPHYTILRRQTALQFCLVGDTVYILNALLGPLLDGVCVVKNQLWALKLTPSMSMTQINDEPQGQHDWKRRRRKEEKEPRNGNQTGRHTGRIRFVRKQERTLPYLRAFAERTSDLKGIAVYHLPDGEHWEDGPLQRQVDEEMLNNGEDGEEAAAFQEE
ncbi:hypothetical protein TYRP_020673 [Tyrophagus putrescentiae]|nr:hypothetical protein TYRP_020673 [Tyrophagus putrescentiae]